MHNQQTSKFKRSKESHEIFRQEHHEEVRSNDGGTATCCKDVENIVEPICMVCVCERACVKAEQFAGGSSVHT